MLGAAVGAFLVLGLLDDRDDFTIWVALGAVVWLVASFVVGDNMRRRRTELAELSERAERAERERELLASRRVTEERTRIARELHDIVAHSVSVMLIQATAARRNLHRDRDAAEALLGNIEQTGRQTMGELRQILGVLRETGDADSAPLVPVLCDLDALVSSIPELDVRLVQSGSLESVPIGVALAAYRVVQEALTNVHRHAGPNVVVEVEVACGDERVDVRVERQRPRRVDAAERVRWRVRAHRDERTGRRVRGHAVHRPSPHGRLGGQGDVPARRPGADPRAHAAGARVRLVIRVALVDDQAMIRQGLRMILEAEPSLTVVGEAGDGSEAIGLVERARPDVVLMDVRMPKMDGIAACEQICAAPSPPKVLMLTTFDLEDFVYATLRAGASGFLLKDAPADQLVEAIEVVARGDAQLAPQITRLLIQEVAKRPQVGTGDHPWIRQPHRARDRSAATDVKGAVQRRDRERPVPRRGDDQDPRRPGARQAGCPGSGAGRRDGLRVGPRRAGARVVARTARRSLPSSKPAAPFRAGRVSK